MIVMSGKVRVINSSGQVKFVTKRIADNEKLLSKYGWVVQDFKYVKREIDESNKSLPVINVTKKIEELKEPVMDIQSDIQPIDEPIDLFESKDKKIKQVKK